MTDRILTPQQELFLASYTNPKSATFSNAYQSALKAGYTEEYSQNIIGQMPEWLSANISDMKLLAKAEKVLDESLEIDINNQSIDKRGIAYTFKDSGLAKVKQDTAKFVAETVGKKRFSKKSPLENEDGQPITIKVVNYDGDNSAPQVLS